MQVDNLDMSLVNKMIVLAHLVPSSVTDHDEKTSVVCLDTIGNQGGNPWI